MGYIQNTYSLKEGDIEKKWYLVNAEGKTLGRLATGIANILRGKHKPVYSPHLDAGDNIVVINAEKIVLSGTKKDQKYYFRHSHWPGGDRFVNVKKYMAEKPEYILEHAVKGMLPKTKLGRKIFGNLKIYSGSSHPHEAQKPEALEL